MRNPLLEVTMLKILRDRAGGLSFYRLATDAARAVDQPYLTRDEILDTLNRLIDLKLVEVHRRILRSDSFALTDRGRQALAEELKRPV